MANAKGTFHVTDWDEKTYQELAGKAKLTRAHIQQDFRGDLSGQATWDLLMCYREDGTAVFTGLGRFEGAASGHRGACVLENRGTFDGEKARSALTVVAGSGTGRLKGLSGKGRSVAAHGPDGTYTFDLVTD